MPKDQKISLGAIARALEYGDFVFYYQPVLSLDKGKLCGAEALIRWQRIDGSLVPASKFIPLAEKTGFITEITQAMLPKVLADMATIHQMDPSLTIAFNVSAKDLAAPDCCKNILREIQEHKVDPHKFRLEITESQLMPLDDHMRNTFLAFDAEGVQIAVDDFGTGYSSIALLRDLPITAIKIDKSFINGIFDLEKSNQIVRHIIGLAHQLGLETVSEGVETQAAFDYLLCFGSTCAQGFYISAPLSLSNFLTFLSQDNCRWAVPPLGRIHLAQQDHIDWRRDYVREILNIVSTQDEKLKREACERVPNLNPKECLLGKWCYGAGQEFRGKAPFDQLEIEHEQLHQLADHLVRAVRAGASREQIVESILSINKHSGQLIELLSELHTCIALKYKALTPDW